MNGSANDLKYAPPKVLQFQKAGVEKIKRENTIPSNLGMFSNRDNLNIEHPNNTNEPNNPAFRRVSSPIPVNI